MSKFQSIRINKQKSFDESLTSCDSSLKDKSSSIFKVQLQPFDTNYYGRERKNQEYLREVWSVQNVPLEFENTSKPSAAVEKILSIRKADCDCALASFKNELENLYKKCEKNIDQLEKNLQNDIDQIHVCIEEKKNETCETPCLTDDVYEDLKSVIESMMCQERVLIEELFENIKCVETNRQLGATEIIKKYHHILRKLFYFPPKDLQIMMENKIMEYNQMALENHKKYEESKLKSRLAADVYKQNFYVWLKEIKQNRLAVCRKNTLDEFYTEYENYKNAGSSYFQMIEGKTALCRLKSRKTIIDDTICQWDLSIPFTATQLEESFVQLDNAVESIDKVVDSFIKFYDSYMSRYICRLYNLLCKLRVIEDSSESETPDEEIEVCDGIYKKAVEDVKNFTEEVRNDCNVILNVLRDYVKKFIKPFQDFGSPWDAQTDNFSKMQDNVMEQLENRAIKSELVHLDLQQKIDDEIEKLRVEESIPKLEKKLDQVFSIVDKKAQKYKTDFDEDCKIIKKGSESVKKEISTLKNKISKFIETNKSAISFESREPSYVSHEESDHCLCDLSFEELALHEVQLIEKQTDSLEKWKSKFVKSLSAYLSSFENDINEVIEKWEEELIEESSQCLDENLKCIEELQETIRIEAYTVRYNDLKEHQTALEAHIKMINRLISESSNCLAEFLDFTDLIENYKLEALQLIEEYGYNARNSSQIICLQNMLKSLKDKFKDKIDLRINSNSERLATKISSMKDCNDTILNNAVLFKDGGNYSTEELNLVKKETTTLSKLIQKDETDDRLKIKKSADQVNNQLLTIEKANFEILNITIEKLKMQEDIINSKTKCKYLIGVRMKQLRDMNNKLLGEIYHFNNKCENKLEIEELTIILNQLVKVINNNFNFLKGPFPEINIPKSLRNSFTVVPTSKDKSSKKRKDTKNPKVNEQKVNNTTIQNPPNNHKDDNYANIVVKLIQENFTIINNKAMNFYTILIAKNEHPSIFDKNEACDDCIESALEELNIMYINAFDFWANETDKFLKFFKNVEMPPVECCLIEESIPDEKEESCENVSVEETDPNKRVTTKVDQIFTQFQSTLQQMLDQLQSKDTNTSEQISVNESSK